METLATRNKRINNINQTEGPKFISAEQNASIQVSVMLNLAGRTAELEEIQSNHLFQSGNLVFLYGV